MARVAIVGAGVSGLSVGLCLAEAHVTRDLNVTIFSDKFSCPCQPGDGITSDRAGGIIRALEGASNYGGADNVTDTRRWTAVAYDRLNELLRSGIGLQCGVEKLPFLKIFEDSVDELPWYTAIHPDFQVLSPKERVEAGLPLRMKTVWKFDCHCVNTSTYLNWLHHHFTERGGLMVRRKIKNLSQLTRDYDVVVNCTGLGARELVGDSSLYPVRGQLLEVTGAHNMRLIYLKTGGWDQHLTYIIPQNGRVLLGGSAEPHNWSTEVNAEQTESIYRRCVEMCPQLVGSKVVRTWAGLRPARPTVRVEVDSEFGGESLLLHNYGHGGHGFTLSWGCATDIAKMIETHLQLETKAKL